MDIRGGYRAGDRVDPQPFAAAHQTLQHRENKQPKTNEPTHRVTRQAKDKHRPLARGDAKPKGLARLEIHLVEDLANPTLGKGLRHEIFDTSRDPTSDDQQVAIEPLANAVTCFGEV